MIRRGLILLLGFVAGFVGPVLRAAGVTGRPNVVFVVADDLRPDALSAFGNTVITTPNLDRLVGRGSVFPRATCGYPICHVSRSEMFSGRSLIASDVARGENGALKFDPRWTLWPQHMARSGWRTIYSGKWHVSGTPWADGFAETAGLFSSGGGPPGVKATYPLSPTGREVTGYTGWTFKTDKNQPLAELGVGLTPRTDELIADRAIEALGRAGDQPFFLQVNFTAPHDPLHWPEGHKNEIDHRRLPLPPNFLRRPEFDTGNITGRDERVVPAPRSEDDVRQERAIYFSLVENLDRQFGRIVRALEDTGHLANTIVIFTSDHGLALGSHGLMGKQNQYEHTINVPLILAGPGVPIRKRFATQCYLRDLYPTVCELVGLPTPDSVQGRSLVPVLQSRQAEIYDAIFGFYTDTQRMVRNPDGWKMIWYPKIGRHQLFNVNEDPNELRDRAAEPAQQERLERMKAELTAWQRTQGDPLVARGTAAVP